MIENTSVGIASTNPQGVVEIVDTGKGYNSENYNYKLFVVSAVQENIGGIGIVTFSLDGYIPTENLQELSVQLDLLEELFLRSISQFLMLY